MTMTNANSSTVHEPKMGSVLLDDLRQGDIIGTVKRDFRDLKDFMLTEERHKRLKDMGRLKRWLFILWWLLKALILKLTPARRILVIIGLVLVFLTRSISYQGHNLQIRSETAAAGATIILFVLMLELKDKLTAQKELEAGRTVQEALKPERSPRVPGWGLWLFTRSANEVGGDLVDFIRVDDNRFGVALGDVAGKGLRAALLMAKLQATLRALVGDVTSLAGLGTKLNQIFSRDTIPTIFASLVYFEVQSESNSAPTPVADSGLVRVLNAGHFPPLTLRGTRVEKMERGGAALGILHSTTFLEQQTILQNGDSLFVYSDGLTEARNEVGEYFGEGRLVDLLPRFANLPTQEFGERLLSEIDQFVGQAKRHDDLSIVILRRE
jgi:sigma-B regulation protein RsbU (phosphoserine phosphatase)